MSVQAVGRERGCERRAARAPRARVWVGRVQDARARCQLARLACNALATPGQRGDTGRQLRGASPCASACGPQMRRSRVCWGAWPGGSGPRAGLPSAARGSGVAAASARRRPRVARRGEALAPAAPRRRRPKGTCARAGALVVQVMKPQHPIARVSRGNAGRGACAALLNQIKKPTGERAPEGARARAMRARLTRTYDKGRRQ